MNKPLPISALARGIERNLFGALLGMLASTLIARFLLLAYQVPEVILAALLLMGAASGAFVAQYGSRSSEAVAASFHSWNTALRRISLKVMLWMLALAAIIGVLTVLTASYDTLGRVAGTVITTAIGAGILWPLSVMSDRENSQAAGLLGMVSVIIVYLLVIPTIWRLDRNTEEMVVSSLIIGLTVPFGMFFLSLKNLPETWIAARLGTAVFVTVLVTFLVATWHPGRWRGAESWWESGWWCAAYGSLAFASLTGMRQLGWDWRWLGCAAAFLAWVLLMIAVWGESDPPEKLIIVISSVAVVIAHASLAYLAPLKSGQAWLRYGTIAAVVFAAAFFDMEVIIDPGYGISLWGRFSGAAAIVASCGSLALIIMGRLNRAVTEPLTEADLTKISHITLMCPRCGKKQTALLGDTACAACGLKIHIAIGIDG